MNLARSSTEPALLAGGLLVVAACSRPNPAYDLEADTGSAEEASTLGGDGAVSVSTTTGPGGGMPSGLDGGGTGGGTSVSGGEGGPSEGDSRGSETSASEGPSLDGASDSGELEPFVVAYPVPWLPGSWVPEFPLSGYERAALLCDDALLVAPPVGCDPSSAVLPFVGSANVSLLDLPLLAPELLDMEIRGPDGATLVADAYPQLVFGPLQITGNDVQALGLAPGGAGQYWTGSYADGTVAAHCEDWSSSFGPGAVGSMDWGNSPVPAGWIDAGWGDCSGLRHLLCLCWSA